MSLESRWFRLNVGWWETDWISVLSAEAQLAWIKFLGRVKTHGYGGTLGKVNTALLARQWMQGEESILQMLKAAKIEGAIVDDGDSWTVPKWAVYQGDPTNAERQRRFKERSKSVGDNGSNGGNALITQITVNKYKDSDRDNDKDSLSKDATFRPDLDHVIEYANERNWADPKGEGERFWHYNESRGWTVGNSPMKNWKAAMVNWEKKSPEIVKVAKEEPELPESVKKIIAGRGW
jgi:hypothetical protein